MLQSLPIVLLTIMNTMSQLVSQNEPEPKEGKLAELENKLVLYLKNLKMKS